MSQSPAVKGSSRLASIRPATSAERRAAAVVSASYALDQEDPPSVLHDLLDALGLYETSDVP